MENKNTFKNSVEAIGSLNSLIAVMQHYNINFKKDNSGFFTNCVFHNDKNPREEKLFIIVLGVEQKAILLILFAKWKK